MNILLFQLRRVVRVTTMEQTPRTGVDRDEIHGKAERKGRTAHKKIERGGAEKQEVSIPL